MDRLSFRRPHWTGVEGSGEDVTGPDWKGLDRPYFRRPHWNGGQRMGMDGMGADWIGVFLNLGRMSDE